MMMNIVNCNLSWGYGYICTVKIISILSVIVKSEWRFYSRNEHFPLCDVLIIGLLIISISISLKVKGSLSWMEVSPVMIACPRKIWLYNKPWIRLHPHLERNLLCGLVHPPIQGMYRWCPQVLLLWIWLWELVDFLRYQFCSEIYGLWLLLFNEISFLKCKLITLLVAKKTQKVLGVFIFIFIFYLFFFPFVVFNPFPLFFD